MISATVDTKAVTRMLTDLQRKQVPFAAAQAVNDVAFQVMRAERAAMSTVFAHPRPFTQRSVIVQEKASKGSPTAIVAIKPEAARYLAPYEFGGKHALPGKGIALLNPKALRLDQYGQIRGKPRAIGDRKGVFVGRVETPSGPIDGMWRRLKGHHLQLLVRFGDDLPVKKHLGFGVRGQKVAAAAFEQAFVKALFKAMARR